MFISPQNEQGINPTSDLSLQFQMQMQTTAVGSAMSRELNNMACEVNVKRALEPLCRLVPNSFRGVICPAHVSIEVLNKSWQHLNIHIDDIV